MQNFTTIGLGFLFFIFFLPHLWVLSIWWPTSLQKFSIKLEQFSMKSPLYSAKPKSRISFVLLHCRSVIVSSMYLSVLKSWICPLTSLFFKTLILLPMSPEVFFRLSRSYSTEYILCVSAANVAMTWLNVSTYWSVRKGFVNMLLTKSGRLWVFE